MIGVPSPAAWQMVVERNELTRRIAAADAKAEEMRAGDKLSAAQEMFLGRLTLRIETWERRVAHIDAELERG